MELELLLVAKTVSGTHYIHILPEGVGDKESSTQISRVWHYFSASALNPAFHRRK